MNTSTPWSMPEPIPVAPTGSRNPALAVAGGTVHLAWSTGSTVYHAFLAAEGWSDPVRVSAGSQPALVGAPDGTVHCLFVNEFAGNSEIYYVFFDGDVWSLPQIVSRTSGASSHPCLTAGPNGSLHAAWADTTPGYSVIYCGRRDGALWTSMPVPGARGSMATLAATPGGDLYIAYQDWLLETSRYDIFCSAYVGSAWGPPENLSDSPTAHSIQPSLVADQEHCHLAWQEERDGIFHVRYCSRRPNGWSMPEEVSDGPQDCRSPKLVANPQGFIELAWLEGREIKHRVHPPEPDAPWSRIDGIPTDCAAPHELSTAIGHTGDFHAATAGVERLNQYALYYAHRQPLFPYHVLFPVLPHS